MTAMKVGKAPDEVAPSAPRSGPLKGAGNYQAEKHFYPEDTKGPMGQEYEAGETRSGPCGARLKKFKDQDALTRDLKGAQWGTYKTMVDVIDRFYAAAATMPNTNLTNWAQLQDKEIYMAQPDAMMLVQPGFES